MQSVYMVNLSYPLCTYESVLHYPAGFLRSKSCVTCPSLFYISALPSIFTALAATSSFSSSPFFKAAIFLKPKMISLYLIFYVSFSCNVMQRILSIEVTQHNVRALKVFFNFTTRENKIFLQQCLLRFQSPIMIFAWVHCFYKSAFSEVVSSLQSKLFIAVHTSWVRYIVLVKDKSLKYMYSFYFYVFTIMKICIQKHHMVLLGSSCLPLSSHQHLAPSSVSIAAVSA